METSTKAYLSLLLFALLLVALGVMVYFKVNILAIWLVAVVEFMVAIYGLFPHSLEGEEY